MPVPDTIPTAGDVTAVHLLAACPCRACRRGGVREGRPVRPRPPLGASSRWRQEGGDGPPGNGTSDNTPAALLHPRSARIPATDRVPAGTVSRHCGVAPAGTGIESGRARTSRPSRRMPRSVVEPVRKTGGDASAAGCPCAAVLARWPSRSSAMSASRCTSVTRAGAGLVGRLVAEHGLGAACPDHWSTGRGRRPGEDCCTSEPCHRLSRAGAGRLLRCGGRGGGVQAPWRVVPGPVGGTGAQFASMKAGPSGSRRCNSR